MALPSQIDQGRGPRASTTVRQDRTSRTVILGSAAALLLVAGALGWVLLKGRDSRLPTAANPITEPSTERVSAAEAPGARTTPEASSGPAEPAVTVLSQASGTPGAPAAQPLPPAKGTAPS